MFSTENTLKHLHDPLATLEGRITFLNGELGVLTRQESLGAIFSRIQIQDIPDASLGMDVARIEQFLAVHGIGTGYFKVISEDSVELLKQALEICMTKDCIKSIFADLPVGMNVFELGTAILIRPYELEKLNGVVYSEGLLVHELVHSTRGNHISAICQEGGLLTLRHGFGLYKNGQSEEMRGTFWEEGFAEMMRGRYVSSFTHSDEYSKPIFGVDRPPFSSLEECADCSYSIRGGELESFSLPYKYVHLETDGEGKLKRSASIPAMAGFTMEILCRQLPQLWEILVESRTNAGASKLLVRELESKYPGLYSRLRVVNYSLDDFYEAHKEVVRAVFGGKLPLNDRKILEPA